MPRIANASLSNRHHSVKRQQEDNQRAIKHLREVVEVAEKASYGFIDHRNAAPAHEDRSILDELIDIHCTPWGVEVREPSFGWHELADDWARVGSYIRNAMNELGPLPPSSDDRPPDSTSTVGGAERRLDEET